MPKPVNEMIGFIDLSANHPKTEESRERLKVHFLKTFELDIENMVDRVWDLPAIMLKEPLGLYLSLLQETRSLYLLAQYYSCVAMAGIVSERLLKDLFREAVRIDYEGAPQKPSDEAFDQVERVEISGLARFLEKSEVLTPEAAKATKELIVLRNSYAHARGKNPKADARKSIELLHVLVEGTVSVFRDYELSDGKFQKRGDRGES